MAKKVTKTFTASIALNPEKGGAWMANVFLTYEDNSDSMNSMPNTIGISDASAWKTASAAKRWVKAKVQEMTPRKSVKMVPTAFNDKEKPTNFKGTLEYKQ